LILQEIVMADSNKHTLGPWVIGNPTEIHAPDGTRIVACCQTHDDAADDQSEANALLIAAAPDLLAALESLHDATIELDVSNSDNALVSAVEAAIAQARAAISKATGQ